MRGSGGNRQICLLVYSTYSTDFGLTKLPPLSIRDYWLWKKKELGGVGVGVGVGDKKEREKEIYFGPSESLRKTAILDRRRRGRWIFRRELFQYGLSSLETGSSAALLVDLDWFPHSALLNSSSTLDVTTFISAIFVNVVIFWQKNTAEGNVSTRHLDIKVTLCWTSKWHYLNQPSDEANTRLISWAVSLHTGLLCSLMLRIFCMLYHDSIKAGIACWLERRTRDRKVASSNPGRRSGRIFFSRVNFVCWLFIRCPFHPRVTAVAR